MRVKRYVVDSMPDALQKIRGDLGKEAVILNTKEIRLGGFLGLFGKKKIEVIAAVDSSATAAGTGRTGRTSAPPSVKQPPSARQAGPTADVSEPDRLQFPEVPDVLSTASQKKQSIARMETPKPAVLTVPPKAARTLTYSLPHAPNIKSTEDQLLEELKQMREMMQRLSSFGGAGTPEPDIHALRKRLAEQELDPVLVQTMLDQAKAEAQELGEQFDESFACRSVKTQMMEILRAAGRRTISPQTKVAHFVGPTGVGKTTSIAKLAAEQVLRHRRKVGFVTSDTYRISAVEQLRTYANILNVPLEVVFSPQDLPKAFNALQECDLIFMDTAGRNFRNELYVSELNALLRSSGESETFLVLSLTTKYKDMKAITGNFTKFKLDKVLFTKMDETDSYGAVVNLVRDFGLQLSYVANGQNVPDDIEEVNDQAVIDLILEDRPNE